jgi:glyoxylase-like metal-dependent hydrolase (beta-lactamase superfamily II)
VLVVGLPAAAFGTNCWILAPGEGQEGVVVDPGIGVVDPLLDALRDHRVKPAAVLLTHGHVDHVWSVTPVCGDYGIPAYIHGADRYRLRDPLEMFDPGLLAAFTAQFGANAWSPPSQVVELSDDQTVDLAGLQLHVVHAPGHTEGEVMFDLPAGEYDEPAPLCLSGDVLFAGSIGRTDLPGGDAEAMVRTLRERVLPLADETVVLPGHGPRTTIGRERATNPFLRGLLPADEETAP